MKKGLRWKPVFSFFCLLALIFFASALFSVKTSSILIGAITGSLAFFAGIFPDHYNHVKEFWFTRILPGTHLTLIVVFIIMCLTSIFLLFNNFRLSLQIEKK